MIVCVGKLLDANVPVHVPAILTTGPIGAAGVGADGAGVVVPQLASTAASDSGTIQARYRIAGLLTALAAVMVRRLLIAALALQGLTHRHVPHAAAARRQPNTQEEMIRHWMIAVGELAMKC
jgi:hypothetical protein